MPPAFLRHDAMRRKVLAKALDDQAFGSAVGYGDQVEIALQLETDATLKISGKLRAGLARDIDRRFQVGSQLELRAFLDQVLDVVFENEQIR